MRSIQSLRALSTVPQADSRTTSHTRWAWEKGTIHAPVEIYTLKKKWNSNF